MRKNRRVSTSVVLAAISTFALLFGVVTAGQAAAGSSPDSRPAAGFMLRSDLNGKCIDIKDFNPVNGALLQMWDCWDGAGQRWSMA